LKEKLKKQKEDLKLKEKNKNQLQLKVQSLENSLQLEKKVNLDREKDNEKIVAELNEKITKAIGGEKLELMKRLEAAKKAKNDIKEKQQQLEDQMKATTEQLKNEEKATYELQLETKKKGRGEKKIGIVAQTKNARFEKTDYAIATRSGFVEQRHFRRKFENWQIGNGAKFREKGHH